MDFMAVDYGKEHDTPYGQLPPGIDKIWIEPKEDHGTYNYHPYMPEIFNIKDNTKLVIPCGQDARYFNNRKEDIRKWFEPILKVLFDLPDNLCIINIRGGEYKGVKDLILDGHYWHMAINKMVEYKHDMTFKVITDDVEYAKSIFPYPVVHYNIGMDYLMIYLAKNLILSNSSFALFPAWLNPHNPYVIAPKYWARHNVSTGYWASSDIWTFGFNFLDREGRIS